MTRIVYLDSETTSLHRSKRRIWDLAYIIRDPGKEDVEKQFFVDASLRNADPISLKIGGYYERYPNPFSSFGGRPFAAVADQIITEPEMCEIVARDFYDAILVGAVPSFDEETLARAFHRYSYQVTWKYHLVDIETLAAGALGLQPPWNFDSILAAYDLKYDEKDRHTALGDARMVRDLYDKVFARMKGQDVES